MRTTASGTILHDLEVQAAADLMPRCQRFVGTKNLDALSADSSFFVIITHETGDARMIWGRDSDDLVQVGEEWRYAAKRIDVVRTALTPEASLVSGDVSSIGPMGPASTAGARP